MNSGLKSPTLRILGSLAASVIDSKIHHPLLYSLLNPYSSPSFNLRLSSYKYVNPCPAGQSRTTCTAIMSKTASQSRLRRLPSPGTKCFCPLNFHAFQVIVQLSMNTEDGTAKILNGIPSRAVTVKCQSVGVND